MCIRDRDYGFRVGKGLYCDMNAIRRDEELDNLHSVYVDQWDWEKVIRKEDRSEAYLKNVAVSYTHLTPIWTWLPSISWSRALPISCSRPARRASVTFTPISPASRPASQATSCLLYTSRRSR